MSDLEAVLKAVNKKFDLNVGTMDAVAEGVTSISTGNIAIDFITGVGGLPKGRNIELYGPPSSGKSTIALQCAAAAQRQGLRVLYLDYEQAMDVKYATALGLDVNSDLFLFAQPDTLEDGVNAARALIETGEIGVVIWDSVAMMNPAATLEAETGKVSIAEQARLMSQALKQLNASVKEHHVVNIFLNHVMEVLDIGGMRRPGMPARKSTPGGRALKFYASVRVEFQPIGQVKETRTNVLTQEDEQVVMAQKVKATVTKNKVGPPFRTAVTQVRFGKGFSQPYSALVILLAHKKLKKDTGGMFRPKDPRLLERGVWTPHEKGDYIRGEANLLHELEKKPEMLEIWLEVAEECLAAAADVELSDEQPALPQADPVSDVDLLLSATHGQQKKEPKLA